jgi:hypothetical protein
MPTVDTGGESPRIKSGPGRDEPNSDTGGEFHLLLTIPWRPEISPVAPRDMGFPLTTKRRPDRHASAIARSLLAPAGLCQPLYFLPGRRPRFAAKGRWEPALRASDGIWVGQHQAGKVRCRIVRATRKSGATASAFPRSNGRKEWLSPAADRRRRHSGAAIPGLLLPHAAKAWMAGPSRPSPAMTVGAVD